MVETCPAHVAEIVRYPVKGLGGEALTVAHISTAGLPFDRAFGLTHERAPIAPFGQWTSYEAFHGLDARPDLAGYRASVESDGPAPSLTIVSPADGALRFPLAPDGSVHPDDVEAATISSWFASPSQHARLISSGFHLWDLEDAPISIINLATLREIGAEAGVALDPRRFRANLFVDGLEPWQELSLPGRHLRVGSVLLEVLRPIERCRAITVDPAGGGTDVNVLAVLGGRFGHIFCGVYARVIQPGIIRIGELVQPGRVLTTPSIQDLTPRERDYAPRRAEIAAVTESADDTVSIELRDVSGRLGTARPGQYLRLHRTSQDGGSWRNYTISRVSGPTSRITVARHLDGRFSPWVHRLAIGDGVLVSGPYGEVDAASGDDELVLLTAGIGITPALAILDDLRAAGAPTPVRAIHVTRTRTATPHLSEYRQALEKLGATARLHVTGEHPGPAEFAGRPDRRSLADVIARPATARVIVCGPSSFEESMRALLADLGVPSARVVSDPFYSPRDELPESRPAPLPGPFRATFVGGSEEVEATWTSESGTLLDVAESVGVPVRAACRAGACGTCVLTVHGPTAYLTDPVFAPSTGRVLVCSAVPVGDVLIERS